MCSIGRFSRVPTVDGKISDIFLTNQAKIIRLALYPAKSGEKHLACMPVPKTVPFRTAHAHQYLQRRVTFLHVFHEFQPDSPQSRICPSGRCCPCKYTQCSIVVKRRSPTPRRFRADLVISKSTENQRWHDISCHRETPPLSVHIQIGHPIRDFFGISTALGRCVNCIPCFGVHLFRLFTYLSNKKLAQISS